MMRTIIGTVLALLAFMPRVAQAQSEQEQVFYYHTDAIGSVRMITDATGQVVARYDYLPFGEACDSLCGTPSAPDPRQFAGKEHNQETGFEYFGARFYSTGTGRFTTVDPMSALSENMADPQLWNRYAYGRNNPLRYVDPDGRYVTDCSNDDRECQQRAAEFERARQANLRSEDKAVSDAAAAYGNPNSRNGVSVYLNYQSGEVAYTNASRSRPNNPVIQVVIGSDLHDRDLQRVVAHEGSHIEDDSRFINSGFNQAFNITHGETEFRAFVAGASVKPYSINTTCGSEPCSFTFGPRDVVAIRNYLRRSNDYGGVYSIPIFPSRLR